MKTGVYSCIIAFTCIFLTSCLKDSGCHFPYHLRVKINAVAGTVDSVSLFVFNTDHLLREKMTMAVDSSVSEVRIPLSHLPNGKYTYVVWGNLKSSQTVRAAVSGQVSLQETQVCLLEEGDRVYTQPDDLFYGTVRAVRDLSVAQEEEVTLSRTVGGVVVKAYNLLGYFKTTDTDFQLKVRGSLTEIPFIHKLTAGINDLPASTQAPLHRMDAEWKKENELLESAFVLMFPSAKSTNLAVQLYHKGLLVGVYEVNAQVIANKMTEITLNFWNKDPEQWFNILDWSVIEQEENLFAF